MLEIVNGGRFQNCPSCNSGLIAFYTDEFADEIPEEEKADIHTFHCNTSIITMLATGEQKHSISKECVIIDLTNDINKLIPLPQPVQNVLNEASQWLQSARQPGVQPATNIFGLATSMEDWHRTLQGLQDKVNRLRSDDSTSVSDEF